MEIHPRPAEGDGTARADSRDHRAHLHPTIVPQVPQVLSAEVRILLNPRRAYGQDPAVGATYILYYVLFFSALIGVAASVSATGRVTLRLLASLSVSWMFVPLLHVLIAAAIVASARAAHSGGNRAIALLLKGHAPWSLWMLTSAVMAAAFGFAAWRPMLFAALIPIALTFRIVQAFCLEVLQTSPRGAIVRTIVHQTVTWLIALVYLEKAVGLVPRIHGWLS